MDLNALIDGEFAEHAGIVEATRQAVRQPLAKLAEVCVTSLKAGGKILFCGNGGSAADAQHLSTELVVRYRQNRPALASIALTTDTSLLTAAANDFSFDEVFSRQVEGLARPGDIFIGISTSGNSPNVLKALDGGVGRSFADRALRRHRPHSGNAHPDRPYPLRSYRAQLRLRRGRQNNGHGGMHPAMAIVMSEGKDRTLDLISLSC